MAQQLLVVELTFVSNDMRVRPGGGDEIIVTDELADPSPGHPAQVEQRDAAVSQVVR
jgi:hypothetical protein